MKQVLLVIASALVASVASAQTVLNPSAVSFDASPDHAAVIAGGGIVPDVPLLDHYEITVTALVGNTAAIFTTNLGKPTPDSQNKITLPLASLTPFAALPKNTLFRATVAAVSLNAPPAASGPSNPFAVPVVRAGGVPVFK